MDGGRTRWRRCGQTWPQAQHRHDQEGPAQPRCGSRGVRHVGGSVLQWQGLPCRGRGLYYGVSVSRSRLVVYIEDNAANFALVQKVLEHGGYEVIGATTGEEGLELVADRSPGVVLLDLDLPGIDGFEVARTLKGAPATEDIPIIAISASVMKQERQQALDAGCVWFIEKPFDIGELRAAVDEALAPPAST